MAPPTVPFSESPWLNDLPSPYYKDTQREWQKTCREFIDEHLNKRAMQWETEEFVPLTVFDTFAKADMLLPCLPAPLPFEWLKKLGKTHLMSGLSIEKFDNFHGAIYQDNVLRSGLMGPPGAITTGSAFAIPPIYKFGSQKMQNKFLPDLLTGSDVASMSTTAIKTSDRKFYVVNGIKKWITNGVWSDYATMAVRTGSADSGGEGLSLLVVPLKGEAGVSMRRLKVAGQVSAGTSFIELDDVQVPVENMIGEEGMGMKYIMTNFNHERLFIAAGVCRQSRVALSTAFEYCMKREAFGKSLMDQPVVRFRLAQAGVRLETLSSLIDQNVYQLSAMSKEDADRELGGLTAMIKAEAGQTFDECVRCAVLLFGGNGYTRTGQGEIIEKLYREVPGAQIPGGSQDVLMDLAIRQLVKNFRLKMQALEADAKNASRL